MSVPSTRESLKTSVSQTTRGLDSVGSSGSRSPTAIQGSMARWRSRIFRRPEHR